MLVFHAFYHSNGQNRYVIKHKAAKHTGVGYSALDAHGGALNRTELLKLGHWVQEVWKPKVVLSFNHTFDGTEFRKALEGAGLDQSSLFPRKVWFPEGLCLQQAAKKATGYQDLHSNYGQLKLSQSLGRPPRLEDHYLGVEPLSRLPMELVRTKCTEDAYQAAILLLSLQMKGFLRLLTIRK